MILSYHLSATLERGCIMVQIEEFVVEGYERVFRGVDEGAGFDAFITVYSSKLGLPFAHCRIAYYENTKDQLDDSLRLSHSMALKASVAGKDIGGAAIVINSAGRASKADKIKHLGQMMNMLGMELGVIPCAGTDYKDMILLSAYTDKARVKDFCTTSFTSYGVQRAIQAAVNHRKLGRLYGLHAAVYGLGKVTLDLSKWLADNGVRLTVTSDNKAAISELEKVADFALVSKDQLTPVYCNLLVPGGCLPLLDKKTVSGLNTDIICGPANAQLVKESANKFMKYIGTFYIPDFIANSGSFIASTSSNNTEAEIKKEIDVIYDLTTHILEKSRKDNKTTTEVANDIANCRLMVGE